MALLERLRAEAERCYRLSRAVNSQSDSEVLRRLAVEADKAADEMERRLRDAELQLKSAAD